jgi:hypothetical protein
LKEQTGMAGGGTFPYPNPIAGAVGQNLDADIQQVAHDSAKQNVGHGGIGAVNKKQTRII